MLRRSERLSQGQNANRNRSPAKQLINPYSIKRRSNQPKQVKKETNQGRYFNSPEIEEIITETQKIKKEILEFQSIELPNLKKEIEEFQKRKQNEEIQQLQEIPQIQTVKNEIKTETSPVKNVSATTKALQQEEAKEESNHKWRKGGKDSRPCPNIIYAQELRIEFNAKPNGREASAVTKALQNMTAKGANKAKKWRGGVKVPISVKRKKLNQRLAKILTPKTALTLLNEFKSGCTYKVTEQKGGVAPVFLVHVEHENEILGMGQGSSKSQAKNSAAENAIKGIFSKTLSKHAAGDNKEEQENTSENLPWAGLASFAIYKLFAEWQSQGADLTAINPPPPVRQTAKPQNKQNNTANKELPPNAAELHPTVVLNLMIPGLTAVEMERETGPRCRVKMGYNIQGQMYIGEGGNKKDARKEAAKSALQALYGLTYP